MAIFSPMFFTRPIWLWRHNVYRKATKCLNQYRIVRETFEWGFSRILFLREFKPTKKIWYSFTFDQPHRSVGWIWYFKVNSFIDNGWLPLHVVVFTRSRVLFCLGYNDLFCKVTNLKNECVRSYVCVKLCACSGILWFVTACVRSFIRVWV